MPAPIIEEGYRKVAFFVIRSGGMRSHEKVGPTRTRGGRKYADEANCRLNSFCQKLYKESKLTRH